MLFICDGAEALEDEQLETMYRLSRGKQGPLGVVLLAKPEFLLRIQNSRLDHIRAALSACFWSQHSSYGAAIYAGDRENQVDGFMPLNPAQLPAPLLERLTIQNEEADGEGRGSSLARKVEALFGRERGRYRRRAITVAFSIGYLLIACGTAWVLSRVQSHPQSVATNSEALPLRRLTVLLPPRAPEAADSKSVMPTVAPAPVAAAAPVAKGAPVAPEITALTTRPEKSTPSTPVSAKIEPLKNDAAPPAQSIENPIPPISASVGTPQKLAASSRKRSFRIQTGLSSLNGAASCLQ